MPSIGWQELMIVMVIVLLIFGTKRLPEVGRSLGGAIKEFKAGTLEKARENPEEHAEKIEPLPEEAPQRTA